MKAATLLFLMVCAQQLCANSVGVSESLLADGLARLLRQYERLEPNKPIASWEELERVNPGLYGINSPLKRGSVTEFFSFVPLDKRNLFPLGNLILVQSKAMLWPDRWKTEDPKNPGKYIDHPEDQEIRFLVYEKDGKFIAEWWYETKFQAMLVKTGLTVPPPTPYYPPPPTPPGEKPADISTPAAPMAASQAARGITPTPIPTHAPVSQPPSKPSHPLAWIAGAIAVIAAVVLAVRRQKPKP